MKWIYLSARGTKRDQRPLTTIISTILLVMVFHSAVHAQYIIHIAGTDSNKYDGDGGPALHASVFVPRGVCRDKDGNLYIGDGNLTPIMSFHVRKINAANSIITTIAGSAPVNPPTGDSADVIAATNARLRGAPGLCMDNDGNLLIADGVMRIRKLNLATGMLTNAAGHSYLGGYSGDGGPATAALMRNPQDVKVDKHNNVYIADLNNYAIRKVDGATGIISTIAGTGTLGYNGDGGPATAASIKVVYSICLDTAGNLYLADRNNCRVRKVDVTTGIISTVAGNGTIGSSGNGGPATAAQIVPNTIAMDKDNNLYIYDNIDYRIRRVDATTGIINAFAGNGGTSALADTVGDNGPATAAVLNTYQMCFDTCGNMYMGGTKSCVRAIVPTLPTTNKICGYTINEVPASPAHNEADLHLSPNPNDGQCTLKLDAPMNEPLQVSVRDITGRQVHQLSATTDHDIELKLSAPPGLYFVTITTATGRWSRKMIVQ